VAISPEIIQRIEKEVEKVLTHQGISPASPPANKRILAIFDAAQVNLALPLQQLDECIQHGYVITVILSNLAAKLLDRGHIQSVCGNERVFASSEITNLQSFTESFSLIVLPVLSYPMAAKLTLGMADTPCDYLIFQAMLRRNRIIATSDALETPAESTIPSEIAKLGQNYMKILSRFGMQFVTTDRLAQTLLSDGALNLSGVHAKRGRTVISASVIAGLAPNAHEFVCPDSAIITPLARDVAARKGMRLVAKEIEK
jgi:hypothetical protein